jgi:hypothetical protein
MSAGAALHVRGKSDIDDRLIDSDELLTWLQLRCGGEVPGPIAIPALLELVRKSRRFSRVVSRQIRAVADDQDVSAWVDVTPREDGEFGCDIVLRNWQTLGRAGEGGFDIDTNRQVIDQHLAELTAHLDADQNLLSADCIARDISDACAAMQSGYGKPWTDFVVIPGNDHQQPLHWRLLDGVSVSIPGSAALAGQSAPKHSQRRCGHWFYVVPHFKPAAPPTSGGARWPASIDD